MKRFCIKIYSEGGQGIKSMIDKLGEDLENHTFLNKYFTTSVVKYDSIIKGGTVEANFIISKEKDLSPFFDKANLCVILKKDIQDTIENEDLIKIKDFKREDIKELKGQIINKIEKFFEKENN